VKKITRWLPGCGCVIHYEWDNEEPEETRIHTPVDKGADGVESSQCQAHQDFKSPADHYEAIVQQQRAAQE